MANRERYGREGNQSGRREREQGDQPYQEGGWHAQRQFDESEGVSGHLRDWPEGRERDGGHEQFEDFSERRGYRGTPWQGEQRNQRSSQSGRREGYGPGSEALGGYGREEGGFGQGGERWGWDQGDESRRGYFPGQVRQGRGYGQAGGYGQGYGQGSQTWGGQGGQSWGQGGYGQGGGSYGQGGYGHQGRYGQGGYGQSGWGHGEFDQREHGQREYGQRGSDQGTGYGERQWDQDAFGGNYGQRGSGQGMGRGEHGAWGQQFGRGMSGGRGQQEGRFSGRGPKGYKRSDDRIKEDISEEMSDNGHLDASDIEIKVSGGEVTLTGHVDSRQAKRMAEDLAEGVSGVKEVHNQLRVKSQDDQQHQTGGGAAGSQPSSGSESSSRSSSRS